MQIHAFWIDHNFCSLSAWPDWVIFVCPQLHKFLTKVAKYFATSWATLICDTFYILLQLIFGQLLDEIGQFLFQHLVTLFLLESYFLLSPHWTESFKSRLKNLASISSTINTIRCCFESSFRYWFCTNDNSLSPGPIRAFISFYLRVPWLCSPIFWEYFNDWQRGYNWQKTLVVFSNVYWRHFLLLQLLLLLLLLWRSFNGGWELWNHISPPSFIALGREGGGMWCVCVCVCVWRR